MITTEFPFRLITAYENMHVTKPNQAYYQGIMDRIGCNLCNTRMVGDDWQRDIEPTADLGPTTYWIQLPNTALPTAYGSSEGLLARFQSGWLQRLGATV